MKNRIENEPVLLGDILPEVMAEIGRRIATQKARESRANAGSNVRGNRRHNYGQGNHRWRTPGHLRKFSNAHRKVLKWPL